MLTLVNNESVIFVFWEKISTEFPQEHTGKFSRKLHAFEYLKRIHTNRKYVCVFMYVMSNEIFRYFNILQKN